MATPQMAPQQPNPLVPKTLPTVAQTLASYRQQMQDLMSGGSNQQVDSSLSQNPWAPDEVSPSQLSKEETDHSAWLQTQPVTAQNQTVFDDKTHQNILRNLDIDPAFKQIDDPFHEVLDHLHQLVKSGQITKAQALDHLAEAAPMIEDALATHAKGTDTHGHLLTTDPDLHTQPELLNKIKGGK